MVQKDFISALDQLRVVLFTNDVNTELVTSVNHCKDLYMSGDFSASDVRSNLAGEIILGFYYVSLMARDSALEGNYLRADNMLDVLHSMRHLL